MSRCKACNIILINIHKVNNKYKPFEEDLCLECKRYALNPHLCQVNTYVTEKSRLFSPEGLTE